MYRYTEMDKIWKTIDDLVMLENILENYYNELINLGYKKNDANEIMDYFVVNKLKKVMEEK